jgi:mitochondrial pyruvate carrier 2
MATPRAGLRFFAQARQTFARTFKRHQTTAGVNAAAIDGAAAPKPSFWNSEIGPKTVHFWAPVMKWGVVAAGASDFLRPAEKLSLTQNMALLATGSIWTRWCFVIRPKNML